MDLSNVSLISLVFIALVNTACPPGRYGSGCISRCGQCAGGDSQCNVATGVCSMTSPRCLPGYSGLLCGITCADGRYGPDCSETCGACAVGVCSKIDGACPSESPLCKAGFEGGMCKTACRPGTFGADCKWDCGGCAGGSITCNARNGKCPDISPRCIPGHMGEMCKLCKPGTWGEECKNNCSSFCSRGPLECDKRDGTCLGGCVTGYTGDACTEIEISSACVDGMYGKSCGETCGACAAGVCNKTDGACLSESPLCKAGFEGEMCKTACRPGTFGADCKWDCGGCAGGSITCNARNGKCPDISPRCIPGHMGEMCKSCRPGTWGEECKNNCSSFCFRGPLECDKRDGTCIGGCATGYNGDRCTETKLNSACVDGMYGKSCSETCGACAAGVCNKADGACPSETPLCKAGFEGEMCKTACRPGTFGADCKWDCGGCAGGSITCNARNGKCPEISPRCIPGHMGEMCKPCEPGTWGEECKNNCSSFCSRGPLECGKRDGTCLGGCVTGYNGDRCTEPALSSAAIIGIGVGVGLLVVFVCFCLPLLVCRNRRRRPKTSTYLTPMSADQTLHVVEGWQDESYENPTTIIETSIYETMLPKANWDVKRASLQLTDKTLILGSYGQTTMAIWQPTADKNYSIPVGLKRFYGNASDEMKNSVKKEVEKLRALDRSVHVLATLGMCVEENTGDILLLLEWTEQGNLLEYLTCCRSMEQTEIELSEARLCKFCLDVATAMAYLSSKQVSGVDLAAETIMLDINLDAKVTGLIHISDGYEETISNKLGKHLRWASAETVKFGIRSTQSDVWSFGVLMWEIYSLGETPYSDLSEKEFPDKLASCYRLSHPPRASTSMYLIMTECWHSDQSKRPTFENLRDRLQQVQVENILHSDYGSGQRDSGIYSSAD